MTKKYHFKVIEKKCNFSTHKTKIMLTDEQVRKTIESAQAQIQSDEISPAGTIRLMYLFGTCEFRIEVLHPGQERKTLQLSSEIAPAVNTYNFLLSMLA